MSRLTRPFFVLAGAISLVYFANDTCTPVLRPPVRVQATDHPIGPSQLPHTISAATARPGGCSDADRAAEAGKTPDELYRSASPAHIPCRGLDVQMSPELVNKLHNTLGIAANNWHTLQGHPTLAQARAQADKSLGQLGSPNPEIDGAAIIQSGVHTGQGCSETVRTTILDGIVIDCPPLKKGSPNPPF